MAEDEKSFFAHHAPDDFLPVCPHCDTEIEELLVKETNTTFPFTKEAKEYHGTRWSRVNCCPHCRKIVGITAG